MRSGRFWRAVPVLNEVGSAEDCEVLSAQLCADQEPKLWAIIDNQYSRSRSHDLCASTLRHRAADELFTLPHGMKVLSRQSPTHGLFRNKAG